MSDSIKKLATTALALAVLGAAVDTRAAVLVNETFEGLTTGSPLTGQGSPTWTTFGSSWQSGEVTTGSGANTSTIVSTPSPSTTNTGNIKTYGNFGLSSSDKLALECLVRAGPSGSDIASIALGNQPGGGNPGPLVGIAFGRFELREDNWGGQHPAKLPSSANFQPVAGTWYQIYSQWDLGTKEANFLVKDVSGTDPNVSDNVFQHLYFDAAQWQTKASLGALSNLTGWEQVRVRLGASGGVGDIDNLQVSTLEMLTDYRFTTSGDMTSSDSEPTSTASAFGRGAGASIGSTAWGSPLPRGAMLGGLSAADETAAISADDYVTFSITPGANDPLNLASLRFDLNRRYSYVPDSYALYADEDSGAGGDNFTTLLGGGYIGDAVDSSTHWNDLTVVLSDTPFLQGITDTTTFRLYLYGSTASSGTDWNAVRLDSVQLFGQIVPEPGSMLLLTLGGLGLFVARRRRKR